MYSLISYSKKYITLHPIFRTREKQEVLKTLKRLWRQGTQTELKNIAKGNFIKIKEVKF